MVGQIFEKQNKVEALIVETNKKIESLKSLAKHKNYKTLTVMTRKGDISIFGSHSRFRKIYSSFGLIDALPNYDGDHKTAISYDLLTQTNPDVLLIFNRDKAVSSANSSENLQSKLIT